MSELPTIYTARFLALEELVQKRSWGTPLERVVPVRITLREPIIPLSYEVREVAESLQLVGELSDLEWFQLSPRFWEHLDERRGRVFEELSRIASRHPGKDLMLTCYENLVSGAACQRRVFQAWHERQTGEPVLEITEHGEALHHTELHRQRKVREPK